MLANEGVDENYETKQLAALYGNTKLSNRKFIYYKFLGWATKALPITDFNLIQLLKKNQEISYKSLIFREVTMQTKENRS